MSTAMTKRSVFLGLLLGISFSGFSQNSAAIYHQLQRLNFLGTVLYVGAHPDDENTRMISHFANTRHARTAYLSLTRGDGGQNLIGTELREGLGLIRTQELLEARKIDGGEQFFTMANDFGYSKNPSETLRIWNRDALLHQVVARIRNFRPDIIINRFDHRTPGRTHGHHTTSALLSFAAFDGSNNTKQFPENEQNGRAWQPKRLFYNTSWWAYGSRERFDTIDKTNFASIDVGAYNTILGTSNASFAAKSRSQHKSQGFGSSPSFGSSIEYLELIKGASLNNDPFEGIDTSWNRVEGGQYIGQKVAQALSSFDFKAPEKSLPLLLEIYSAIQQLNDAHWKAIKTKEVLALLQACGGWHLALTAPTEFATPNSAIGAQLQVVNPTQVPLKIEALTFNSTKIPINTSSANNNPQNTSVRLQLPNTLTTPYWLRNLGSQGQYVSPRDEWIGRPETPRLEGTLQLNYRGTSISLPLPLTYRTTDPVEGEVIQNFQLLPQVSVRFSTPIYMMPNRESTSVVVQVFNHTTTKKSGQLRLELPQGWTAKPATQNITLDGNFAEGSYRFEVFPTGTKTTGTITPKFTAAGKTYTRGLQLINYPHIEKQFLLQPSVAKVVPFSFSVKHKKIGYIQGAGDKIPEGLTALGIQVDEIAVEALSTAWMEQYPTIILGIRSFNVAEAWQQKHQLLLEYVRQGGNVIVQYNTSRRLKVDPIGPYPLQLSRQRVTDETATVKILEAKHPLFTTPNAINAKDFEDWVQERGLYFASSWDDNYTPLLAMNDPGEAPLKGSLLVSRYGKGSFIFTGLSFFRQFPAGVPGAYRLFANLISYE